jgi:probable HAF family extracellular repeat protein
VAIDLGMLGGALCSVATAINNAGQAAGVSRPATADCQGAGHGFLWTATDGMINLGTLGGWSSPTP